MRIERGLGAESFKVNVGSCAGTVVSSMSAGSNRLAACGGGRCSGEDIIDADDVAVVSSAAGAASGAAFGASGAAASAASGAASGAASAGAAVGVAVVHAAVAGVAGVVAGAESFKVNVAIARE